MTAPLYAFGGAEGAVAAKGRQYAARGVTLSAQEAMDEIAADFTREMLYHIELFRDLVRQDRSLAKWVMDGLTDFIRRVKNALSGQTAREGGAGDGYGATLSALEEAALLWQAAYDAAAAAAGSLKNTGADGIIEGKKFSTKARRGRSIEQETMENNRFERLRRFGDDLPLEWYAYTANFFYIFSNHSFTDYTIISKMRISDSNRSKIGSIMEEYESAYRTGEIVDSWTETVQRRSGCGTRDSAVSSGTGAAGQTNALDVRAQERDDAGDPAENSGVGRRENRRKFSLKSTDSEGRQLSAAQRELDVDRIRDASESAGFGESGKRALTAAYDGEPEAAAYFAGFSVLYHAGLTGVEEGKVKSPYISPLTPAQRYAAYTAGQNDAAAARSERLQDARADGTMGTTKYSLKEELKHGGSREETRGEFLRRAAGEGYSVFEGKTTAYGYRGPVQLGHETAAQYIREELQKLGISCIITDGSVLWNRNGYTGIRQVEEAVTAQGEAIFINGETSIPAKQVAGHEAFHLWKNGTGRDAYIQTIEDNLVFTSKEFLEYQDKISKKYLGGEADLSNDTQINQLREELFAYISGHIHEGTNDDFLRPMFRRYDAVKGAWRELLRQNGADGSAFFLQGDNAAADMPQE